MKGEIDEILPFYMIRSCKDVRNEFLNKLSLSIDQKSKVKN